MIAIQESRKSRKGEANGRHKLKDLAVRELRLRRASASRPPIHQLARHYRLCPRHVKRLIYGLCRVEAGGPIELPPSRTQRSGMPPVLNCENCGKPGYAHPEIPDLCLKCGCEAVARSSRTRQAARVLQVC
jgi:hypothetical protein